MLRSKLYCQICFKLKLFFYTIGVAGWYQDRRRRLALCVRGAPPAGALVLWCLVLHSHRLFLSPQLIMISIERYEIIYV